MNVNHQPLILAAAELARSSPEAWGRFMVALELYSSEVNLALINSPPDTLAALQGHAREVVNLLKMFHNCVATADKIKGKK